MTSKYFFKLFSIVVFVFFLSSCIKPNANNRSKKKILQKSKGFNISYDLGIADNRYKLPSELIEVSGLTFLNDSTIACVQDELGELYTMNIKQSKITSRTNFGKDGDYEGIAYTQSKVYVLRSNGKIYEIQKFRQDEQVTNEYKTPLRKYNNPQGIVYDEKHNRLLIACNGTIGEKATTKNTYSIYAFNLNLKQLNPNPVIQFSLDDLYGFLNIDGLEKTSKQFAEFFHHGSCNLLTFETSGMAIHPISGNYYLVSSKANLFMVLSPKGKFQYLRELDKKTFHKPEGITFHSNGDLFISNEGKMDIANITRFNYVAGM